MSQFKSFVSETELEDKRKKRQDEWEKVRKPEDPTEAPEEEYDPRSLYERLKEQKDKKQADYEEAHKLRNMVRGLDDDEVQFLDFVDRTKEELEAKKMQEENKELNDFRKAVAELAEKSAEQRLQELKKAAATPLVSAPAAKKSQSALLASVIKRKSTEKGETSDPAKKTRGAGDVGTSDEVSETFSETEVPKLKILEKTENQSDYPEDLSLTANATASDGVSQLKCIGILPGLGVYNSDSSDSENSSCSDMSDSNLKYDLLGRRKITHVE